MEQAYIFDFGDKIKAGYSTNVKKRLRTIELSSGVRAKQVYSVEASRKEEYLLHSWLKNRLEGEFFAFPFDEAKQILDDIVSRKILKTPYEIEIENRKFLRANNPSKTTEAQKRAVKKAQSKCDAIMLRPSKEEGARIRAAAAAAGQSNQQYILQATRDRMNRESGE